MVARWKNIRDGVMLLSGLTVLFHQIMITHRPSFPLLLIGFGLIGLSTSLFAARMLSGDKSGD